MGETSGMIEFDPVAGSGRILRRTGALRYAVPNGTTTDLNRLQEEWQDQTNGGTEWRDVPTVVVPGLQPRHGGR